MRHDQHPNDVKQIAECADRGKECEPVISVWAPPPEGIDGKFCRKCGKYFPPEELDETHKHRRD